MNSQEKIHLLELLTSLAQSEADLIWTRFSALLYASTGLLGILTFAVTRSSKGFSVFVALFGLLLSFVWLQMIRLSSYYYQRWQADADHLISTDENIEAIVRGRVNPRIPQPAGWSASKYSTLVPLGFALIWILVILNAVGVITVL